MENTTYSIATEQRNYNHVHGPEHFKRVRENCQDYSKVIMATVWKNGAGWQRTDKRPFEIAETAL